LGDDELSTVEASEAMAAGRALEISPTVVEVRPADEVVANELQIDADMMVITRRRLRFIDGIFYALQIAYYPLSLVEQGATRLLIPEDISESMARYLEVVVGIKQASQRDTIIVRRPNWMELEYSKLVSDELDPVVEISQTVFDESAKPLWVTVTSYPAEQHKFVLPTTIPSDATGGRNAQFNTVQRPDGIAGHVFISYVREDSDQVDQLQRTLEAAGVPVWRDTADLWPGRDWRAEIRHAITDNALVFIACFSQASVSRRKSYQNEELELAIAEIRQRPPNDPWLIPVRLSECEIPDRDIGTGRTLKSIQRADLFGEHADEGVARLLAAILEVLGE
jgi:hypothetical protein